VTTNGQAEKHFAALAIGAMIMAMVFAGGHISGGHYNPAVSLGVWVRQKMQLGLMIAYIVVQLVGGTAAALIAYELTEQAAAPTRSVSNFRAVTIEALFTFALVTVMLNCATTKSQDGNSFYGLAIGFTVTGGGFAAGPYTGGVFNPAVGTALIFAQAVHPLDNDGNDDLHLGAGFVSWRYCCLFSTLVCYLLAVLLV
jgi:aquaporin Z